MKTASWVLALTLSGPLTSAKANSFDANEQQLVHDLTQVASQLAALPPDANPKDWQLALDALAEHVNAKAALDVWQEAQPLPSISLPQGVLAFEGRRTIRPLQGMSCRSYRNLVARIDSYYVRLSEDTVRLNAALKEQNFAGFRSLLATVQKGMSEIKSLNEQLEMSRPQNVQIKWPIWNVELGTLQHMRESAVYAMPGGAGTPARVIPRAAIGELRKGFWWTENQFVIARPMSTYLLDTPADSQIIEERHGQVLMLNLEVPSAEVCFGAFPVIRSSAASYTFSTEMFDCDASLCRKNEIAMVSIPEAEVFFYSN
jgi:hypothetical protein